MHMLNIQLQSQLQNAIIPSIALHMPDASSTSTTANPKRFTGECLEDHRDTLRYRYNHILVTLHMLHCTTT